MWLAYHSIVNANASTPWVDGGLEETQRWLSSTDYYSGDYPYLLDFDNATHLIQLLQSLSVADLHDISRRMEKHIASVLNRTLDVWDNVLRNVFLALH